VYKLNVYMFRNECVCDVLDGLETIRVCTGYEGQGNGGFSADSIASITPIYEELPGWTETTLGAKTLEELPANARAYISYVEAKLGVPIDIISTGPDRAETITLRHPFA